MKDLFLKEIGSLVSFSDPNNAKIKLSPDVPLDHPYTKTHLQRFEKTFDILQRQPVAASVVLDLGTNVTYHPELHRLYPDAQFFFGGTKKEPNWFSIDLEKEKIPLEDESVDLVFLFEVIEHFYEDPMFCLSEVNRVLKDGGFFYLTTPNLVSWKSVALSLCGKSPLTYGKYHKVANARRHVHEYTPESLDLLVKMAGFIPKTWTDNSYHEKSGELIMSFIESAGFPKQNRGDTIFCLAQKAAGVLNRYPKEFYD